MNSTPLTLEALAVRVTSLEKTASENHEAHGSIYARLEAVEKGHAVLDTSLTNIWTVLKEIQADLKELKARPVKRFDKTIDVVLQWLIVAILAAVVVFK